MSRLIIHIGTHKTATTSIQHYMNRHRSILAERGLFYPSYELIGRQPHYAHLGMVNGLVGQHQRYTPEDAERFFRTVRERAQDFDTTLISAEPLYRHTSGPGPGSDPQDYWPARMEFIERIHDLLGDAEIVVVFRRQADYAQSLYQEQVKVTQFDRPFKDFLNAFWFHFDFLGQAKAWEQVFPGLRALSFEKLIGTGDAVAEFSRLLELPVQDLPPAERHNEAMPVDMVVLKRLMQGASSKDEAMRRVEQILAGLNPELLPSLEPRSFFDNAEHRAAYQAQFNADNEALRQFMVQDYAPQEPTFPEAIKPDTNFGDSPHPRVMASVLRMASPNDAAGQSDEAQTDEMPLQNLVLPSTKRAEGTPLSITVLGDMHAKFFYPNKMCPLARCGFSGSSLKITNHKCPTASLTTIAGSQLPQLALTQVQQAADTAEFLCLAFGQADLELGYYARVIAHPDQTPSREAFVSELLELYSGLLNDLKFDAGALVLKGTNLTTLRGRGFALRSIKRQLDLDDATGERIDAVLASETEQNAMGQMFNSGLQDIAKTKGFGYFDMNVTLSGLTPKPEAQHLARPYRPAALSVTIADTIEVRHLHLRHLLKAFGADPTKFSA